jgi:hypothetical protein
MYACVQLCMRGAHTHPVLGVKEAWPDRPFVKHLSLLPPHMSLSCAAHYIHCMWFVTEPFFTCDRTLTSEVEDDGEMKSSLSRTYTTNDSLIYLF